MGERELVLHPSGVAYERDLGARLAGQPHDRDLGLAARQRLRGHDGRLASGALPVPRVPEWPLNTGRRYFEHVALPYETTLFEPRLDRTRDLRAVIDAHARAVSALDTEVEHGAAFASSAPELDKLEAKLRKFSCDNVFQLVVHSGLDGVWDGDWQQKMWGATPHWTARPGAADASGT